MIGLTLHQTEIPGLAIVRGNCKVTGKPYKTGPVDFETVRTWINSGMPTRQFQLPYPEETVRFIVRGISPKGWRIINEPVLT